MMPSRHRLHVNSRAELAASVHSVLAELLLDAQDLVELRKTLRTCRRARLDLARSQTDDDVGDGHDLVDLEQKSVAGLGLDSLLDKGRVGDGQVITNDLEVRVLVEVRPGLPVLLSEWVLNGDDGVLGSQVLVLLSELLVGDPLALVRVRVLEVEVVLLLLGLVKFGRGNVHGNVHLASVASLLNGLGDQAESLIGSLDVWCDTALVTDV